MTRRARQVEHDYLSRMAGSLPIPMHTQLILHHYHASFTHPTPPLLSIIASLSPPFVLSLYTPLPSSTLSSLPLFVQMVQSVLIEAIGQARDAKGRWL